MGTVAEQVREIGATIERGLVSNGWDQRPTRDRRLFASYRTGDNLLVSPDLGVSLSDLDLQCGPFGERALWTSTDSEGTKKRRDAVFDTSEGTLSIIEDTWVGGQFVGTEVVIVSDDPKAEGRPVYPSIASDTPRRRATEKEGQTILAELKIVVAPLRQPRNAASEH